jgi:polysaccharide biosynthesis/export protein
MNTGKSWQHWIMLLSVVILASSCVPQKKLRYLQHDGAEKQGSTLTPQPPVYRIAPNDLLHIQVVSAIGEIGKVPGFDATTNVGNELSTYLQGYPVDGEGKLRLPMLGEFQAAGLTIPELQQQLTAVARQKVSLDAEVVIRHTNFRISVLGEVKNPGVLPVYAPKISILEALALAGDLTAYGNRKEIILIREVNGKSEIHTLDLTNRSLLASPHFYLQNNDVLYIQPLNAKTYGFAQVQWGVIVSSVSTLIAILALVLK